MSWGHPGARIDKYESVFVDNGEDDQEWRLLGRPTTAKKRDADIQIEVVVLALKEGEDERAAETRMWELVDEVMAAVREDVTLAGTVEFVDRTRIRQESFAAPQGWLSQAVVQINCTGRV